MKKIYYFLMAAFVAVCMCAACSSGDEPINDGNSDNGGNGDDNVENVPTTEAPIVGKWNCLSCEGNDSDGYWKEVYNSPKYSWMLVLQGDGTGVIIEFHNNEQTSLDEITWKITSAGKIKMKFDEDDEEEFFIEMPSSGTLILVSYWESADVKEKYTFERVE